jgi:hypothetical protein
MRDEISEVDYVRWVCWIGYAQSLSDILICLPAFPFSPFPFGDLRTSPLLHKGLQEKDKSYLWKNG